MINQLTVDFKNKTRLECKVFDWNGDVNTRGNWNPLFDWYQHSAMSTYVLEHKQCSYLISRDQIDLIYCEMLPDPEPALEKSGWARLKALFTST